MTASYANQEIWHVIVTSDDVKRMNVDQLDDAFRLDVVDASTLVWKNGMPGWQRLGAVAGLDADASDWEPDRWPPQPARRSPQPTPPPAFATPLYAPPMYPPRRMRASVPSYVDFRRRPGSVRWGRWLFGLLLVTGLVLVAYRQNLLREGARRIGIEGKYLYGERSLTSLVSAKASPKVKNVLTRLALLPGPNALPEPVKVHAAVSKPKSDSRLSPAAQAAAAAGSAPSEGDVRTVSLESLPVLTELPDEPDAVEAPPAKPQKVAAAPVQSRKVAVVSRRAKADKRDAPEPKAAPRAKPSAPVASDSPLKAAIRSAIAAEQGQK